VPLQILPFGIVVSFKRDDAPLLIIWDIDTLQLCHSDKKAPSIPGGR
jgi:hypothetical protein